MRSGAGQCAFPLAAPAIGLLSLTTARESATGEYGPIQALPPLYFLFPRVSLSSAHPRVAHQNAYTSAQASGGQLTVRRRS
jgi:hypothetical protein